MKSKKKQQFKTPEGYFDNFHERLMGKIVEDSDSSLNIIPKNDGFTVPQEYFETVGTVISKKVKDTKTKVIPLYAFRKYAYAAAALAAVFLFVWGITFRSEPSFNDLAAAEIDSYFEESELNLTSYELAEVIALEDIELKDMVDTPYEEENILEYLDETVDALEDLNIDYDELE
ncbi:MAG: hypothetical protein AAGB24_03260 [Bacteroidota bacterium]